MVPGRFHLPSPASENTHILYIYFIFFVFRIAEWININIINISNFYISILVATFAFFMMLPIGYLSMRFLEAPFLRLRKPYYIKFNLAK